MEEGRGTYDDPSGTQWTPVREWPRDLSGRRVPVLLRGTQLALGVLRPDGQWDWDNSGILGPVTHALKIPDPPPPEPEGC